MSPIVEVGGKNRFVIIDGGGTWFDEDGEWPQVVEAETPAPAASAEPESSQEGESA